MFLYCDVSEYSLYIDTITSYFHCLHQDLQLYLSNLANQIDRETGIDVPLVILLDDLNEPGSISELVNGALTCKYHKWWETKICIDIEFTNTRIKILPCKLHILQEFTDYAKLLFFSAYPVPNNVSFLWKTWLHHYFRHNTWMELKKRTFSSLVWMTNLA